MGDSPLILVLVKGILHCFGWICAISAFPALIWYSLTNMFPVWLGESVILGYFLYSGLGVIWIAVVAAIGLFIATLIGAIYSQKNSPLKDIFPEIKIGKYFKTFGNGLVDFAAFICFCVNVIGVIRIPGMLISAANADKLKRDDISLRLDIFRNFLLTFVDWVTLPFLVLLPILFPWRIPALNRRWKTETDYVLLDFVHSFQVRGWVFYQFFSGLIDVPVFLFGLTLMLVFSWRIPTLYEKLSQTTKYKTIGQRRGVIFKQAAKGALDFLMVILSLFVFLTPYRLPVLFASIFGSRCTKASHRRWNMFYLFGMVWLDLLCLLCLPFVLLGFHRLPHAFDKCSKNHWKFALWFESATSRDIVEPYVQIRILKTFGMLCVDLPFLLMGLFVTILIWRAFFMWKDIVAATDANDRRKKAAYHFGMLFIDIIDFPFVLMAILMFITGWRAPHLWKSISKTDTRNEIRLFVISQFGWWLLDIPTLFLAFIVLLSIYRAKNLVVNLKEYFKNYAAKQNPPSNLPAPIDDPALAAENPKPKDLEWSWHMVVFKELALLLLDLPFPILTVLTLWRMPWLIRGLITQAESARERRVMVLSYLWKVAKDIPCAALFLLMVVTVWRIPSIFDMYKKYQKGDDEHRTFLKLFIEWLIDLPFVLMGCLVILWIYRFPFLIRALITECKTVEAEGRRGDVERRYMTAQYFAICLLDIVIAIQVLWICGTMWRIPSLVERYHAFIEETKEQDKWRHTLSFFAALTVACGLWLLDIWSLIQFAIILGGIFHIPSFFVRAYYIISLWMHELKPITDLPHTDDHKHEMEITGPMPAPQPATVNNNTNQPAPGAPPNSSKLSFGTSVGLLTQNIMDFDPADDYARAKKRFDDEEISGKYFSLSLLRVLLIDQSMDSVRHFPHLFLIPLKIAALVFVPLHALMALRLKKYSSTKRLKDVPYDTVFTAPLYWISMVSLPRMNFWGMDQFFILNMLGIVFVLPNEIALIPLAVNSIYIFIITFGSPLWNSKREMLGWMGLGSAPGKIFGTFDAIMMVFQIIGVPIFIALQWFLLFLPLFIISIFRFGDDNDTATAHDLFKGIFSSGDYWKNNIGTLAWYWWILFAYWFVIMVACWEITIRHLRKFYPMFDPLIAYLWLVQRVMAGTFWRIYSLLLSKPTTWSYMNRRTCGCLGELLMFPIFIIWAYWPIIIPFVIPNYFVFIGSLPVCLFLTWRGYTIVKGSWAPPPDRSKMAIPQVHLTSMTVQTPESGGLAMTLVGQKPADLTIENARLLFEGEAFWKTLNSAIPPKYVSAFKMAAYPVVLAPSFMNPSSVRSGTTDFYLELKFGMEGRYKVSKKALYKNLQKMVDKEEGAFDLLIEYGTPKFGWQTQGTLIKLSNIKLGQILDAAQNGTDLVTGGAAAEIVPPKIPNSDYPEISGPIRLKPSLQPSLKPTVQNRNDSESDSDTDVENPPPKTAAPKDVTVDMPPVDPPTTNNRQSEISTEVDMKLVQRFVEMGFDQERVLKALLKFSNNEEQTLNYLLSS